MTLARATEKQRAVLIAYLRHGSYKKAAKALKINENTARTRMSYCLKITGCRTAAEAAYLLGLEGVPLS